MQEKIAYSVEEAAQALSLGITTVKKLLSTEELTSIRVGRRRLIPRSALESYIERLVEEQEPT